MPSFETVFLLRVASMSMVNDMLLARSHRALIVSLQGPLTLKLMNADVRLNRVKRWEHYCIKL